MFEFANITIDKYDNYCYYDFMTNQIPLRNCDINKVPGHWLFARLGKKVLRPGGKAFTKEILQYLEVNNKKEVVEFAPGLGVSTKLILDLNPKSYIGIDMDETVCSNLSKSYPSHTFKQGLVQESELEDESKDVVISEAILTMNSDSDKDAIIKEADRILKSGGRIAIHEVCYLDGVCDGTIEIGNKSLSRCLQQDILPIRKKDWEKLLKKYKFKIIASNEKPRDMLAFKQLVKDEGFFKALSINTKIAFNKDVKARMNLIKTSFTKQDPYIKAFYFVAEKK